MNYRNPKFTAAGTITLDLWQPDAEGDGGHWMPFHVVPSDSDLARDLDALVRAEGAIEPFTPPAPPALEDRELSPARMEWLLAFTGLGDVWAALEAATKDTDRATFATLRAQRAQPRFRLPVVLSTVAALGPLIQSNAPDVDLSPETIRAAWAQALEVNL